MHIERTVCVVRVGAKSCRLGGLVCCAPFVGRAGSRLVWIFVHSSRAPYLVASVEKKIKKRSA